MARWRVEDCEAVIPERSRGWSTPTPGGFAWTGPDGVPLAWTPCYFGGMRTWLLCPECGRRCAKLYRLPGCWSAICRRCARLTYTCQAENRSRRATRRARKVRERLGGGPNVLLPLPPKPPRMHWRTYARLVARYHDAQDVIATELDGLTRYHSILRRCRLAAHAP